MYYIVKNTRAKIIAEETLKGSNETDCLIHDDYGAYQNLPTLHQSCWSHLIRNARDYSNFENASINIKELYEELQLMYSELKEITEEEFNKDERLKHYNFYLKKLQNISNRDYSKSLDAQRVQKDI